ncbi:MAG: hypothetical protein ACLRS1_03265 [Oscillospiraceae bacterium]
MITHKGSPLFSGVAPPFFGVSLISTSLSRRPSHFPGVTLKLLLFLVYTRFSCSSSHFSGVPTKAPDSPAVPPDSPGVLLILSAVFDVFIVAPSSKSDMISLAKKSHLKKEA